MKKYLLLYIMLSIVSMLQAQNKAPFYGLKHGFYSAGDYQVTQQYGNLNNSLISTPNLTGTQSFPLSFDAVPHFRDTTLNYYEIGKIPDQTIAATTLLNFYVKCDSLIGNKTYSILPLDTPKGKITFNNSLQFFSFIPDSLDTSTYHIRFRAIHATDTISQTVAFKTYQLAHPQMYSFGVGNGQPLPDPNANEYQLMSIINNPSTWFNEQNRPTRSISVSGVDLKLENASGNLLATMSGNNDIAQLNIYADRLYIKDVFNLPQTEVNIYCRQLIFEDGVNIAAINTTPIAQPTSIPGVNGIAGATAGRINVFAGQIIDNGGGIRFRLIGGDGGASTNATAGNGGNGGILFSTQDIASKGDYLGGIGGIYSGTTGMPALKNKGDMGAFNKDSINLRWIHPNYIRQYISYCNDAYFVGYGNVILPTLVFYSGLISNLTNSPDTAAIDPYTKSDVMQVQMELITLIDRITSGNDYFGNPVGWVPLLSFEFTKAAFDSELDHAMKILYLDYFISTSADTAQKRINGFTALKGELQQRSTTDKNSFNDLVLVTVPDIENKIDLNNQRMLEINNQIQDVMVSLQARADKMADDQKSQSWQKWAGALGTVATMIPFPPVQAVGAGVLAGVALYNGINHVDNLSLSSAGTIIGAAGSAWGTYQSYQSKFAATDSAWTNIGDQWQSFFPVFQGGMNINAIKAQIQKGKDLEKSLSSVYSDVKSVYDNYLNVSDPDLKKMRSDLMANDPALASLNNALKETADQHKELVEEYDNTNDQILTLGSQIMAYGLAFDDASNKVSLQSKVLDHRTVHYIHYLRENALKRLKKYYYYMAKAYEARTLLPFTGNLNLAPILSSIESMAISANNSVLTPNQYATFSALYEQQVDGVAQNIYDDQISNGALVKHITVQYSIPREEINKLNRGESVIFNPTQRGLFQNYEENIRIENIRVLVLNDTISPGTIIGNPAEIDVLFEYPSVSNVRRNGKVYYFNNYNRNTNTPITWGSRYDVPTTHLTDFEPSSANASLLISLLTDHNLPHLNDDVLMYTRPSADADLILSSTLLNNNGNGNIGIDSLRIQIEYDFNTKPSNISYLDILPSPDWIVPYYNVSKPDINSMQNGQGKMTRAYSTNSSNIVNVKVENKIGGYRFERWLDKDGNPVVDADSINPSRNFTMNQNRIMKPKYKWAGAILSLPDTLYFTNLSLTQNLIVKNTGETASMYWVRDTISSFASVGNNITTGFGNDTLSISLTNLSHDTLGYIAITAPEAENAIDTVWLKYHVMTYTYYRDADGDGYGNPNVTIQATTLQAGYVTNNTDCNDANANVNPGHAEICGNGIDDNCNGQIDEGGTAPTMPGTITAQGGNTKVCPGTSKTYSIASVVNVTGYTWTPPTGASITSGQNTTSVTILYSVGFTASGTLNVTADNGCTHSALRTLTITRNTPAKPGVIAVSGGSAAVCPGDARIYAVANASGVTYTWTPPAGASITSGQGTNSILVIFNSSFTVAGTLSVSASNGCGISAARTLTISKNTPVAPGKPVLTSGPVKVCSGNVCSYAVTAVTGMTYTWTGFTGAVITPGPSPFNTITVSYTSSFTASSGTLSVTATNGCGTGAISSLVISKNSPATPSIISGQSAVCAGSTQTYSITPVAGATSYIWTVPSGTYIQGGQGTTNLTVIWGSAGGVLKVKASNACSNSANRTLTVIISCGEARENNESTTIDGQVFPNPTNGISTFHFVSDKNDRYEIKITDISGKQMISFSGDAILGINEIPIDLSEYAKGVYFLNIVTSEATQTKKLIKE